MGERAIYYRRCGWCGAYDGTVDPQEPCARDSDTGEYIGPHEFGVVEPVGGSPEVERSVAVRVAIRDADMIERVLGVLEGHGTVSMTEIRTAIGAVARIRRALATPSEGGMETEGRDG